VLTTMGLSTGRYRAIELTASFHRITSIDLPTMEPMPSWYRLGDDRAPKGPRETPNNRLELFRGFR
jgi:hypothetical protein